VLFDPARQFAVTKVHSAFPNLHVSLIDWTPDLSHLIVKTSGTDDSGTYYAVDINAMSAKAVGYERLAIAPEQVGPVSTIEYKAADGLEIEGILTLPPGREPKNLPVVMLPHGGPYAHDIADFDWWAQAFASRGYAVLQPNFRGSTNRDAAFRNAAHNEWGRKMETDISDGLAELARRGIVDPKRACIMGASYGGYAALAGVTLQHGIYRCAVSDAGVSDLRMMYQYDVPVGVTSEVSHASMRDFLGDPSTYDARSPRMHAAEADAPVLLTQGKDDTVVPFEQSQVMYDALKAAGKPVEMVVMAGEDHWLSTGATRLQMLTAALAFVEKYNPPDPVK
jgi:dipeptidyl aminopeptidase/acylaminoacyl peptidase